MEHFPSLGSDPGLTPGANAARCLSFHSSYRCRSAGACCTAGWAIPVEVPLYEILRCRYPDERGLFRTDAAMPEGTAAMLGVRAEDGACVFFERDRGRLCRVHRQLGPATLPSACRQFPRVTLRDARGVSISLSHYCPTAAALLFESPQFVTVAAPPSLALAGDVEGLDARDVLPPLLTPGMLTDSGGYDAWEQRAIAVLARDGDPGTALHAIAQTTMELQSWRPGCGSLAAEVHRQFDRAPSSANGRRRADEDADVARVAAVLSAVPNGLSTPGLYPDFVAGWQRLRWPPEVERAIRAYLAARLFGNWIAYYGRGLHTVVEYLRAAYAVVRMEAVRQQAMTSAAAASAATPWQIATEAIRSADLLLVHLSDPKALARALG